jgi:hypothetical protein
LDCCISCRVSYRDHSLKKEEIMVWEHLTILSR